MRHVADCFPRLLGARFGYPRGILAERCEEWAELTSPKLEDLTVTTDDLPWISELNNLVFLGADNVPGERITDLERIAGLEYVDLETNC